jgi:plastocyanin
MAAGVVLCAMAAPLTQASGQTGHGEAGPTTANVAAGIGFDAFAPPQIVVLAGDTVTWTNRSVRQHTVTAVDGSWSSDRLFAQGTFAHRFDAAGPVAFFCRVHPSMRGEVAVQRVLLTPPVAPAAPGRPFPLTGRAALPAGGTVSLEADDGTGFRPVGNAIVAGDGTFSATVTPRTVATYRAVAGTESSPPVQLLVLDRRVAARARTRGRSVVVSARVTPASAGTTVVLQLRLPERFGWWPVARTRLDRSSAARFAVRLGRRVSARVVVTLPDGATSLATSRTLRVGTRASARRVASRAPARQGAPGTPSHHG